MPGDLTVWPRRGATIAASLLDTRWDYEAWARMLGAIFGRRALTQVNVLSALWPDMAPHMELPFVREADGRFDLRTPNPKFYDRLVRYVDVMNRNGVLVQLCFLELYSWSFRKTGVPDQNRNWSRYNVNGVRWGGPSREEDDATLISLPDAFLSELVERVVTRVKGAAVAVVPFNEGPEKAIHEKIAAIVKRVDPAMNVVTNRNDDTPGQYQNMRIGQSDVDRIAYHGWRDMGFLDVNHSPSDEELQRNPEGAAQRPWTFREFFDNRHHNGTSGGYDYARTICSSDGSRSSGDPVNTYDWPRLLDVFRFVVGKGGSVEHQSRAKMTPGARLDMVETAFLRQMAEL